MLLRVAKNIKLFEPNMILMVPLMIETLAKKLSRTMNMQVKRKKRMSGKRFRKLSMPIIRMHHRISEFSI